MGSATGTVTRCSNDTTWTTLYSGIAEPASDEARAFRPNLCPYAYQTQFIRLDMDTAAVPGWNNVDAVMISGSQETPTGLVLPQASKSHPNRVLYKPLPGIHGSAIDSFMYVLSDCVTSGDAATATMSVEVPVAGSTADIAFQTTEVSMQPGRNITTTVDFAEGWDRTSIHTQWPFSDDQLIWSVNAIDPTVRAIIGSQTHGAGLTELTAGFNGTLAPGNTSISIVVVGDTTASSSRISLWVTTASSTITVRYIVEATVEGLGYVSVATDLNLPPKSCHVCVGCTLQNIAPT